MSSIITKRQLKRFRSQSPAISQRHTTDIRDKKSRQIESELIKRIVNHHPGYNSGDKIPAEVELTKEFECDRYPVGEAVNLLADKGLVIRIREGGVGSFVRPMGDWDLLDRQVLKAMTNRSDEEINTFYSGIINSQSFRDLF